MTSAAVTVNASYKVDSTQGYSMYQISYSKANAGDTLDLSTYTPMKSILFAFAKKVSDGSADPIILDGSTTITFSAGTLAGSLLVVGK